MTTLTIDAIHVSQDDKAAAILTHGRIAARSRTCVVEHALRRTHGLDVGQMVAPMIAPDPRGDVVLIVRHAAPVRAAA